MKMEREWKYIFDDEKKKLGGFYFLCTGNKKI